LDDFLRFMHARGGQEAPTHTFSRALSFERALGCFADEWEGWETPSFGYVGERALRVEPVRPARRSAAARPPAAALEARVQKLEQMVEQLLAEREPTQEEIVPKSPHDLWIEAHCEELRNYPDSFIALDAEKGVVIHAQDGDEFEIQLEKLSPEERDRVALLHTSMYVR
jgi:hypothetical protein